MWRATPVLRCETCPWRMPQQGRTPRPRIRGVLAGGGPPRSGTARVDRGDGSTAVSACSAQSSASKPTTPPSPIAATQPRIGRQRSWGASQMTYGRTRHGDRARRIEGGNGDGVVDLALDVPDVDRCIDHAQAGGATVLEDHTTRATSTAPSAAQPSRRSARPRPVRGSGRGVADPSMRPTSLCARCTRSTAGRRTLIPTGANI